MKITEKMLRAAFQIALFNVNKWNVDKHEKSKYIPLVSTTMYVERKNETFEATFKQNEIFKIGFFDNIDVLRESPEVTITLDKSFKSFCEIVKYFQKVIHKKVF